MILRACPYKMVSEFPASTLQNAAAYAAFANGGTYYEPTYIDKIETADGQVNDYSSSGKRVMQSSTAYMITDMLKQVITWFPMVLVLQLIFLVYI